MTNKNDILRRGCVLNNKDNTNLYIQGKPLNQNSGADQN